MTNYEHPNHGKIVKDEWDHRGELRPVYRCKRCNCMVPRDATEKFDAMDCDNYKDVSESISGSL